jgi:ADP-heptose:LPS heptosyltransferase
LASTSAADLAQEVLDSCLQYGTWPARALEALVERALDEEDIFVARAATRALFGVLVERLGDLFDPPLCEVYARLFSHVIAQAFPEYDAASLLLRYNRVRQVRRFPGGEIRRVFVLSRVTLGADIAVTSVALAAAKERFPDAEICLVGPAKNAEMFAGDDSILPIPVTYGRASLLRERLTAALELKAIVDEPGSLVIDPDSRLTQLGLIPVCDDSRYFFFESRAFGGEFSTPLSVLTAEWLSEVFDVEPMRPYLAPFRHPPVAEVAVSFGVGENSNKRLDDEFEYDLLAALLATGRPVVVDRGAGGEEAERVNALATRAGNPPNLHFHDGSYASFASQILQSKLYVGYDSAGQHVAAAGEVPLVSIFAGYVCDRMFERWRPNGPKSFVVPVDDETRPTALARTLEAIAAAAEAA